MLKEYSYRIEIEGGGRLVFEGVDKVLDYSPTTITLKVGRRVFDISGEKLSIARIEDDALEVIGDVAGVARQ